MLLEPQFIPNSNSLEQLIPYESFDIVDHQSDFKYVTPIYVHILLVKTLRELCDHIQESQKSKTRKINVGESVVSVWGQPVGTSASYSKQVNQIIAPGDMVINELYCSYCGISCNSPRQWDEHCMSEKHINNVNSDKEHQWNFRQPPWGQGSNLALCAK